jgi:hypothetical protein
VISATPKWNDKSAVAIQRATVVFGCWRTPKLRNTSIVTAILVGMAFASAAGASSKGINIAAKPFCAKPIAALNPEELKVLNGLSAKSNAISGTMVNLWPTRSIPVVFHSSLNNRAKETFNAVAKHLREIGGVALFECDADLVAVDKKIEGYVVVAEKKTAGCSGITACSKGLGFLKKTIRNGLNSEDRLLSFGRPIGLILPSNADQAKATEVEVLHEFLHRLGALHQHQSPFATDFIASGGDKVNCQSDNRDMPQAAWTKDYDPGSVMHYHVGRSFDCEIELKGCKEAQGKFPKVISSCNLDKYLAEGRVCAYKGTGATPIPGDKCFKVPRKLFGPENYGASDYDMGEPNGKACLSVLDQAWLRAAYGDKNADAFELNTHVPAGKCRPL